MSNKQFVDIVEKCNLSVNKDMIIEVQLCPDCKTEVSKYNNNYLCPNCSCLKTSCITRKITINKSNGNIKNKKFEYKTIRNDTVDYLNEFGQEGWEICGIIQAKSDISINIYNTVIYLKREIIK